MCVYAASDVHQVLGKDLSLHKNEEQGSERIDLTHFYSICFKVHLKELPAYVFSLLIISFIPNASYSKYNKAQAGGMFSGPGVIPVLGGSLPLWASVCLPSSGGSTSPSPSLLCCLEAERMCRMEGGTQFRAPSSGWP